ncbi:Histone-Lysine N-Methyltransferase ash1l [Chytridiales sp. JEL 0842]|nr:Histone-Lysine N-Methyltransferase ash1l [Chytridiales sp. JEL 0842]
MAPDTRRTSSRTSLDLKNQSKRDPPQRPKRKLDTTETDSTAAPESHLEDEASENGPSRRSSARLSMDTKKRRTSSVQHEVDVGKVSPQKPTDLKRRPASDRVEMEVSLDIPSIGLVPNAAEPIESSETLKLVSPGPSSSSRSSNRLRRSLPSRPLPADEPTDTQVLKPKRNSAAVDRIGKGVMNDNVRADSDMPQNPEVVKPRRSLRGCVQSLNQEPSSESASYPEQLEETTNDSRISLETSLPSPTTTSEPSQHEPTTTIIQPYLPTAPNTIPVRPLELSEKRRKRFKPTSDKSKLRQIRNLFQLPVLTLFCQHGKEGYEFQNAVMEFGIRSVVGVDSVSAPSENGDEEGEEEEELERGVESMQDMVEWPGRPTRFLTALYETYRDLPVSVSGQGMGGVLKRSASTKGVKVHTFIDLPPKKMLALNKRRMSRVGEDGEDVKADGKNDSDEEPWSELEEETEESDSSEDEDESSSDDDEEDESKSMKMRKSGSGRVGRPPKVKEPKQPKEPKVKVKKWRVGKVYKELEAQWDGAQGMKEFYATKPFLNAGLYSGDYVYKSTAAASAASAPSVDSPLAVETPLPMEGDPSTSKAPANQVLEVKTKDPKRYWEEGRKFQFAMPKFYGKELLETEEDFELPYDIFKFREVRRENLLNPANNVVIKKKPAPYTRVNRNIFVDRKPRKPREVAICSCTPPEDGAPGCGEECLNRCMFIECHEGTCPTGEACSNQVFQRREEVQDLEVFYTPARGHALRTNVDISSNTFVVEYCGEIISQETCVERMNTIYKNLEHYYFLNYAQGEVIDGCRKGNEARFVNHSCDPNCRIEKWSVNGEFRVGLFALRDIPAGTELTYDYRFEAFGPMQRCMCGSIECRGFIGINKKSDSHAKRLDSPEIEPKTKKNHGKAAKSKKHTKLITDDNEEEDPDTEIIWSRPTDDARRTAAMNGIDVMKIHFKDTMRNQSEIRSLRVFLIRNVKESYSRDILDDAEAAIEEASKKGKKQHMPHQLLDEEVAKIVERVADIEDDEELWERRRRGLEVIHEELMMRIGLVDETGGEVMEVDHGFGGSEADGEDVGMVKSKSGSARVTPRRSKRGSAGQALLEATTRAHKIRTDLLLASNEMNVMDSSDDADMKVRAAVGSPTLGHMEVVDGDDKENRVERSRRSSRRG